MNRHAADCQQLKGKGRQACSVLKQLLKQRRGTPAPRVKTSMSTEYIRACSATGTRLEAMTSAACEPPGGRRLDGRRDGVPSATPAREKGGTCRQQGGEHVLAYSCNRDYLWGLAGSRMARPKELTAAPRIGPHQPYSTCSGQPALHLRPQFEVTRAIMLAR